MLLADKLVAHFTKEPDLLRSDSVEFEIHVVKYYQGEDDSWNFMIFRDRSFAEKYADWVRNHFGFPFVFIEDGYAPAMIDPVCYQVYCDYIDRVSDLSSKNKE